MKIMSFVMTVEALLQGKKRASRRFWSDKTAAQFKKGDLVQAFNKNPRNGGECIAIIRLTKNPFRQHLDEITEKDFHAEGGLLHWSSINDFIFALKKMNKGFVPFVIEFELVHVLKPLNLWWQKFWKAAHYYAEDDGIVLGGDARQVLSEFPAESAALFFTDPDYSEGSLLGFWLLAKQAPRILKQGGVLITEAPHKYLNAIQEVFQLHGGAQDLRWRWLYNFLFLEGAQRRLRMGIHVITKPLLCYSKGKWKNRGFVKDGLPVKPQKKVKHKWQKNLDGYLYFIERHTDEGDIVIDPFAGSGTTAFACRQLKRRFVVIDIDDQCCRQISEDLRKES